MNTSFSKIRHIQEANQRLEKRMLSEQDDDVLRIALRNKSYEEVRDSLTNIPKSIVFISIIDCEYADFDMVDLCNDYPKLKYVVIKNTDNNFEEQEYQCIEDSNDGMYTIEDDPEPSSYHYYNKKLLRQLGIIESKNNLFLEQIHMDDMGTPSDEPQRMNRPSEEDVRKSNLINNVIPMLEEIVNNFMDINCDNVGGGFEDYNETPEYVQTYCRYYKGRTRSDIFRLLKKYKQQVEQ